MTTVPLQYFGDGQFQAMPGHAKRMDKALVIGEVLQWEQINSRSVESHKHYFAVIADAWANLPELWATALSSPEHLRKHCLIMAGYCTTIQIVCATNSDAVKACAQFKAMDTYCVCSINDRVATVSTAISQSVKAMGGKVFQQSKERVLQIISEIIGADATELGKAA
jgi:hypothetical protein